MPEQVSPEAGGQAFEEREAPALLESGRGDESNLRNPDPIGRLPSDRFPIAAALAALGITLIPYLFGWSLTGLNPAFGWFSWLGYNLDDGAVYLSWLRQAADGHFFQRNLFTTEPQDPRIFNLFFLALGSIARLTGLPLLLVWHSARILLGLALLAAVWGLLRRLLSGPRERLCAFLLVCFSAGFGWAPGLWVEMGQDAPVDVWMPEAVTFLSLYLNPLNVVSLLLMTGVIRGLIAAEDSGSLRPALLAGLWGLLLGNIHGYDVITLAAVWTVFLIARMLHDRRLHPRLWLYAAAAGAPALLSAGYMYLQTKTDPLFAQRVAVPTLSPPIFRYVLGYGLILPAAVWGVFRLRGERGPDSLSPAFPARLFLAVWVAANFAVAYLPVPFQRKMIMGVHLPLCMLAGVGLASALGRIDGRRRRVALAVIVLVYGLTNLRFLTRDMRAFQQNLAQSGIQRPYLKTGERYALEWIRQNAPEGAGVQPLPWVAEAAPGVFAVVDTTVAAFTPGLTGRPVNAGHWGETPRFAEAIGRWRQFLAPTTPDSTRMELLRDSGVRFLLFTQTHDPQAVQLARLALGPLEARGALRRLPGPSSQDAEVFEVVSAGR